MKQQIRKSFLIKIWRIFRGWKVWHRCIKRYSIMEDGVVIVLPSCDEEFNRSVIRNLDKYLLENKEKNAVLIVSNLNYSHIDYSLSRSIVHIEKISAKEIENVMMYYATCYPENKMIVADIDKWDVRRNIRKLMGVSNITIEEIVKFGIYKLENDSGK